MAFIYFDKPYFLILLLPAASWFLYFYLNESKERFALKKKIAFFTRILSSVILIMALAEPGLRWKLSKKCVIYAVDVSKSFSKNLRHEAYSWISRDLSTLKKDDYFGLVVFSREGSAEILPQKKSRKIYKILNFLQEKKYVFNTDLTDIGHAIQLSSRLFPEGFNKEIVIITDGNENKGSLLKETLLAKYNNIHVNFMFLEEKNEKKEYIKSVNIPKSTLINEEVLGEVVIGSTYPHTTDLSILINNKPHLKKNIHIEKSKTVRFPLKLNESGCFIVSVLLGKKNRIDVPVEVLGSKSILYVTAKNNILVDILKRKNFLLKVIPPSAFPMTISGLESYSTVVVDNIGSSSFTRESMKNLQQYSHDFGGGVVMVGGKKSFGAGGYFDTPVEKLLPVYMDVRNEKRKESLNVVFVLDKSQSMGKRTELNGPSKMELAMEASINALDSLKKQDMVGVVGFDNRVHRVLSMTSLLKKDFIKKKILKMHPEGKTNILLGINTGFSLFKGQKNNKIRHMIVFSDGKPSEKADYEPILSKLKRGGITLSSVGVGDDLDKDLMRKLAEKTGGRLYLTEDIFNLGDIFKKDLAIAARSMLKEGSFIPRLKDGSPILAGIGDDIPALNGYILTTAKKNAITPIVSDTNEPIISYWQYGLGKTAVFTTDSSDWLSAWQRWDSLPNLWTSLVKIVQKTSTDTNTLHLFVKKGNARQRYLVVDAISPNGDFLNDLPLKVLLFSPDGIKKKLSFSQSEPGRYLAAFSVSKRGVYSTLAQYKDSSGKNHSKTFNFPVVALPEYSQEGGNENLLKRVVNITGGELIKKSDWERNYAYKNYKAIMLWKYFLLFSIISFLVGLTIERFHKKL